MLLKIKLSVFLQQTNLKKLRMGENFSEEDYYKHEKINNFWKNNYIE